MIVRKCQYGILNHPPHPICCDSIHQGRREEALQIHISIVEGSSIKQEAKSRRKSCKKIEKNLGNKGIQGTFTELKRSPELSPEFVEVRRSFVGAKSGRLELHKLH
ncbi:unnamed protein product [Cuscuta europaea]|uniref:Uncharacterized protein n=1 Tax=Cuscuta europaea TaxID=41803 RepID=A0A9P0ZMM9_CUSEU|nr:unnamed protein product [Cuscuta europaea]CAH9108277.1 unnamed protein product [Cuscuta europaea]